MSRESVGERVIRTVVVVRHYMRIREGPFGGTCSRPDCESKGQHEREWEVRKLSLRERILVSSSEGVVNTKLLKEINTLSNS